VTILFFHETVTFYTFRIKTDEFFTTEDKEDKEKVEPEKEKPTDDENIKNQKKNQGKKRKFSSSSEEDPGEKPVAQPFPKLPLSQRRGTINSFDDSLLTDGKYEHNFFLKPYHKTA